MISGERSDDESGQSEKHKEGGEDVAAGPSARLLIQALIDNGIINATNKATIRIIDNSKPAETSSVGVQKHNDTKTIIIPASKSDLSDFKTLNLGSFVIKQAKQSHGHTELQQQTSKVHQKYQKQEVFVEQDRNSDAAKSRRIIVQNQNSSGNFVRICQQNQNQVILDNSANVVQNTQGNLVLPIISGSNLIRLSDGSLVIPVQRVDGHKKETDPSSSATPQTNRDDKHNDDTAGYASIVFSERSGTLMDSEPPPLLILPTEDSPPTKPSTTQNCGKWAVHPL